MAEPERQAPTINVDRIDAELLPDGTSLYVIESEGLVTLAFGREHITPEAADSLSATLNDMLAAGGWRQGPWPPPSGS